MKITNRKNNKLKWGAAGCGRFLENTFIPSFQQLKKSKLVSVYSGDIERAKHISKKFHIPFANNNFEEFLKSDFNVLYISSVNADHYEQVIKGAKAGKHILCEKPLALNSKQAKKMVEVCKENNVMFSVNYVHRFHPILIKTKELLNKNLIGRIISVSADFCINFPPGGNFRHIKKLSGGGALRDIGTHMIDILRFLCGEINDIIGYVDNIIYKSEVDDFASAIIKFDNNNYGRFNVSYSAKKAANRIEIFGHDGYICIDNLIGAKGGSAILTINTFNQTKKVFRKRANKQLQLLREFQKSIIRKTPLKVTGEDGLKNLVVMEKLEKYASKRRAS
ncbi:MAG: Gfo/Idh/MocA family oxidoreductase [Ignavibacteriales bacterium]|nr:Gfo/Idh/MocA family oxidoreductase [Ignavibacteriales bacterium]